MYFASIAYLAAHLSVEGGLFQDEARFLAEKRGKIIADKKKELVEEAKRKLEAGEKLTLDEMKLAFGEE